MFLCYGTDLIYSDLLFKIFVILNGNRAHPKEFSLLPQAVNQANKQIVLELENLLYFVVVG